MKKPYLIAEIGVNFYDTAKVENISPFEAAKKYIHEAKKAGIDAVKFQSYKADTIVVKDSPAYWDLSKEPTGTQYELFKKHDSFDEDDYRKLKEFCDEKGIDFLSTPFDYNSANYLETMVKMYKISSSDLNNIPFLRHIAKKGKPILLSVGASYLSEVDEAIRIIKGEGCNDITLLHCVLSYPTKYEDANLNVIRTLKQVYPDLKIGYSDHTLPDDSMTTITTAYLLGAQVIEKHFTLDKSLKGNDHYHAGDPSDFVKIVMNLELIRKICGDKSKTVLKCEETSRKEARRSLVIVNDKKAGEKLLVEDIDIKRPGKGIAPIHLELVIGRTLKKDIKKDTVLLWDMV